MHLEGRLKVEHGDGTVDGVCCTEVNDRGVCGVTDTPLVMKGK